MTKRRKIALLLLALVYCAACFAVSWYALKQAIS
jgi:hypothetical protein